MMAAVEKAHVESPADLKDEDTEPQDDSNNSGSDGGSEGEGSDEGGSEGEGSDEGGSEGEGSDEGGSDDGGQSDSGSDGEQAEDEEGNEDNKEAGEGETNPNAGWAEAMAKILQKKTPESKPTILLKNKQLDKLKEKEKKEWLEKKKQIDKKRAWEMMSREKPDLVKDRENERNLQRISTRGVVQLFNAVRKHQKTMDDKVKEVGGSERKKVKLLSSVSKKDFINVLRGTEGASEVKSEKQTAGGQSEEKPAWSVLRDDYMMGASMKDWDKESDQEGGGGGPETKGSAEDYNSDSD